jgi:phosphatidylglycerophosphate synthase
VRIVRRVALPGVVAQVALLGLLAGVVGLTIGGWLVGMACGLVANALLVSGLLRSRCATLGVANGVTLARTTLVGGAAALVTSSFGGAGSMSAVVTLAAIALALDAVDGWVARRTNTITPVGARFDGEVDAFLILVLSVYVARSVGAWVLAIGLMRYAFLVAGVLPWMRVALPARYWRKVVAATQGIVLTLAAADVLPHAWASFAVVLALILLAESFGRDVRWLVVNRWRPTAQPPPSRLRRVAGWVVTGVAVALVWSVLVAPDRLSGLRLTTFLRVPIEGLAVVAVAIALPPRLRVYLATLVGLVLSALTVIRAFDFGFFAVLDRPFNVVTDWGSLGPAIGVLGDSIGQVWADLLTVVAIVGIVVAFAAITLATVRVSRVAARHRVRSVSALTSLALVWVLCAAFGVTTGTGAHVAAATSADLLSSQVQLVRTGIQEENAFSGQLAKADRFALTPSSQLLTGLRGKDVLLVFVESYGQVAVQGSFYSPQVDDLLRQSTKTLDDAGFSSRSAFMTSPTFGGSSWLAHSTLQSGLWVDNPHSYDEILASNRMTLSVAFKRAGWRTVTDIPSSKSPWPQGQHLYHFDTMYGTTDVGYNGPAFSYAKIPDQYTLQAFYQRELAPSPRRPVMAEIDLVSSHTPWAPLPKMVPWDDVGDGSVYDPMPSQGQDPTVVWRDANDVKAAYGQSIEYSLTALTSFIERIHDDNLVVIMLGDHQPATVVSGSDASHNVPISIIAHDPSVMDRIASWGWQDGLLPSPQAPLWRMDTFRDRFLTAFGPGSAPGKPALQATN